jgi:hypothetical protein
MWFRCSTVADSKIPGVIVAGMTPDPDVVLGII